MAEDNELVQEAKVNSKDNFLMVFSGPFEEEVIKTENSNKEFFERFFSDEEFRDALIARVGASSTGDIAATRWLPSAETVRCLAAARTATSADGRCNCPARRPRSCRTDAGTAQSSRPGPESCVRSSSRRPYAATAWSR